MLVRIGILIILYACSIGIRAQAPKKPNAADIHLMLKKLNVLGSVMYVAAHPDDENTRMIAYYANEKLFRTAYLSATRGDGGQNLIGPEIREGLGIIRTQELLAARRTDGGSQFFSRANDFGYSKDPDETFNIWDREKVLADFVWNIRKFRPDVLITRFSLMPKVTHGHHTASAILANEAFDLAGDPSAFPEQLEYVEPWQPRRIFWNTSWWFYRSSGQEMDTAKFITIDVGAYNTLLGKSYNEIAALSRSMHKSQGFGATGSRGSEIEYLEQWKGDKASQDPFEGIDTSWGRVDQGEKVAEHTQNALHNYMPDDPARIIPDLLQALKALEQVKDEYWASVKRQEIHDIIKACLGLYLEVKTDAFRVVPGDSINLSLEAINRANVEVSLSTVRYNDLMAEPEKLNQKLSYNTPFFMDKKMAIPAETPFSQPYWLKKDGSLGMYTVEEQTLIGLPENPPALTVDMTVKVQDYYLDYTVPVVYKTNDPVDGEVYKPLAITPPVFANITDAVYIMANGQAKPVNVKVIAGKSKLEGALSLELPVGWSATPASIDFSMENKGEEQSFDFMVTPPANQDEGLVKALVTVEGKTYNYALNVIDYDHIPMQTRFPESNARIVNIDIQKRGESIGYIMGAGDEIPASLRQIGYDVTELGEEDINTENLQQFDAVILGVRAFNTVDRLKFLKDELFSYVENGGTMVVQYNTSHRLVTQEISPVPLKLSRDRVTVEEAPVRFLAENHPVLNFPNKITQKDFEGWVQERGLYFPNEWDDAFTPILSSNDPGEEPLEGGLLVAPYGKGYYIYTGYSWFRELPAGVSGAYRLFTNLISIGHQNDTTND